MATFRLADREDDTKRRQVKTRTEIHYWRTYDPPSEAKEFEQSPLMPTEGDMMPGEDYSVFGPFIAREGISWEKPKDGTRARLVLHCIKLRKEVEA